jgi:hypothetical protein
VGITAERDEYVDTSETAWAMSVILEPLECLVADVASVPRRFGVGVLLILMTAFAVLFAGMRTFGAQPELFIVIAGLFFAVTLGQILLFEGKQPRKASIICGAIAFPVTMVGLSVYWNSQSPARFDGAAAFAGVVMSVPGGAILGYLAGCLMAGVFFAQESYRRRSKPPLEIQFRPFTAADFDTLKRWVRYRPLFELWSQRQLRYPLDDEQLQALASPAEDFLTDRLAFKAVWGQMQEMVAFVELTKIDLDRSRANIELAIVDPMRDDRDQLSDVLLREIIEEAFERQQLQWLSVVVHRTATGTLECFHKHGFSNARDEQASPSVVWEYQLLTRGSRY